MKKSNLKNGMIVEYRNGERKFVFENVFYGLNGFASFECYDDNLLAKDLTALFDIVKVYKKTRDSFGSMLKDSKLELIWERKEIDWSKVPLGTKVRVWDEYDTYVEGEGIFLEYKEDDKNYPFRAYIKDNDFNYWSNCELIEEPVTYEEINIAYESVCEKQYESDGCRSCKYKEFDCNIAYILDNYNVTRK